MRNKDGYTVIFIDGRPYAVSLPTGGKTQEDRNNDWDHALDAGCRLNCKGVYSWCLELRGEWQHTIRGNLSDRYWYEGINTDRYQDSGFRPVLTPLDPNTLAPDSNAYQGMDGLEVELGSITIEEEPYRIITGNTADGKPIKWAVFGGKLIAVDNLATGVSWNDLNALGYVPVRHSILALVRTLASATSHLDYEIIAEADNGVAIRSEDGQIYTISVQQDDHLEGEVVRCWDDEDDF